MHDCNRMQLHALPHAPMQPHALPHAPMQPHAAPHLARHHDERLNGVEAALLGLLDVGWGRVVGKPAVVRPQLGRSGSGRV